MFGGPSPVNPTILLQKLIDIERSIGVETESTTRRRVLEAQDYLLQTHWGSEEAFRPHGHEHGPNRRFSLLRNVAKAK